MIIDKIKAVAGMVVLACVAVLILAIIEWIGGGIAVIALLVVSAIIIIALSIKGFLPLQEKQRAGVTRFGKYHRSLKEGWHVIIYGIEKAKLMSIKKRGIAIDEEGKEPWLDCKGGGSVQMSEAKIWIKGDESADEADGEENIVYKALFAIENYEELMKEHAAAALKNFVNSLDVEDVYSWYTETRNIAKKDIMTEMETRTPDLADGLSGTVMETGHTLEAIFAKDWNFSKEVLDKRREVYEAEMDAKKAPLKAEARDIQIGGAIRKIVDTLVKDEGYPKAEAEKIAPGLFKHMTASEGNQLSLHEFDGLVSEGGKGGSDSGDLFSPANITRAVEIFKTIMGNATKSEEPKKEKKEPDEDWF